MGLDPLACGPGRASTAGYAVSTIGFRSRLFVTLESVPQGCVANDHTSAERDRAVTRRPARTSQ